MEGQPCALQLTPSLTMSQNVTAAHRCCLNYFVTRMCSYSNVIMSQEGSGIMVSYQLLCNMYVNVNLCNASRLYISKISNDKLSRFVSRVTAREASAWSMGWNSVSSAQRIRMCDTTQETCVNWHVRSVQNRRTGEAEINRKDNPFTQTWMTNDMEATYTQM